MAKNKNNHTFGPSKKEWAKKFGRVVQTGSNIVLEAVAPSTAKTVSNAASTIRDSKSFFQNTRAMMNTQVLALERSNESRDAKSLIRNAFNDIKNGTFNISNASDFAANSDSDMDDLLLDLEDDGSKISTEAKATAALSKTISSGNTAMIDSMKHMTESISSVSIKSSAAMAGKITNTQLYGINLISSKLSNLGITVSNMDNNISSLIKFQNQNQGATNQRAIEYYSNTEQLLYGIGQNLAEMKDASSKYYNGSSNNSDRFKFKRDYVSGGFDFASYGEEIKNNFKNSMIGTMVDTFGTISSISEDMGGTKADSYLGMVKSVALPEIVKLLLGKTATKSFEKADSNIERGIKNTLYRIGDMSNDFENPIKTFIGEVFGLQRPKLGSVKLTDYYKDNMSWNGIAQKSLVEIIPAYLANIEAAIKQTSANIYDPRTGKFTSEEKITDKYKKEYANTVDFSMSSATSLISKELKESGLVKKEDIEPKLKEISNLINKRISGGIDQKEYMKLIHDELQNAIPANSMRNIVLELEESYRETIERLNAMNKEIASNPEYQAYRNILMRDIADSKYKSSYLFENNKYTSFGKLFDDLTEEERLQEEKKKFFNEKAKKKKESLKNRFFKKGNGNRGSKLAKVVDRTDEEIYRHLVYNYGDPDSDNSNTPKGPKGAKAPKGQKVYAEEDKNKSSAILKGMPKTTENVSTDEKEKNKIFSILRDKIKVDSESTEDTKIESPLYSRTNNEAKEIDNTLLQVATNDFRKMSLNDIIRQDKSVADVIQNFKKEDKEQTSTAKLADVLIEDNKDTKLTLKGAVLAMANAITKPFASVFGKDGIIHKFFQSNTVRKWVDKLFNEEDGAFRGVTKFYKNTKSFIGHLFTGKEYTDKNNVVHKERKGVNSYLRDGYNNIQSNFMRYLFSDNYKENEDYQKYLSWTELRKKNNSSVLETSATKEVVSEEKPIERIVDATIVSPNKSPKVSTAKLVNMNQTNEVATIIREASEVAGNKIIDAAENTSKEIFGTSDISEQDKSKITSKFSARIKKHLPKDIAAGITGAGAVMLSGGSMGLIGSLFLPGGPIGGAIAGIGLSIAARSKTFTDFVFGKKDLDGKRSGGVISDKSSKAFKKALPAIVGGGVLGAFKHLVFGSATGPIGLVSSALLPGGVIGGAILGAGLSIAKQSETFNKVMFGEKDDDGKRSRGIFAKGLNKASEFMHKNSKYVKGAIKGLAIGALTSATIGQFGVVGSALALGGPVGGAIAGLSLGIASNVKIFRDYLFGRDVVDANGNIIGKSGDGVLTKLRNALVVNVLDPVKDQLRDSTADFAYWAKDKIMYPFRLAFGPIVDSMKGLKESLSDFVYDKFNKLADGVGGVIESGFKSIFAPMTKIVGKAGTLGIKAIAESLKMTGSLVASPINLLSYAISPKRRKFEMGYTSDLVRGAWKETAENSDGGILSRGVGLASRLFNREYRDEARSAYVDRMELEGRNSFGWMTASKEKKESKKEWQEEKKSARNNKAINKLRQQYAKEDGYVNRPLTEKELAKRIKKFVRLGVDKETIGTEKDLRDLIYNKDEWKDRFFNKKDKEDTAKLAKDQEINESVKYQKEEVDILTDIRDIMWEMAGIRNGKFREEQAKKMNRAQYEKFEKKLKKAGVNMEDLNMNPDDWIDYSGLTNIEWQQFRNSDYYASGDFNSWFMENKQPKSTRNKVLKAKIAKPTNSKIVNDEVSATEVVDVNDIDVIDNDEVIKVGKKKSKNTAKLAKKPNNVSTKEVDNVSDVTSKNTATPSNNKPKEKAVINSLNDLVSEVRTQNKLSRDNLNIITDSEYDEDEEAKNRDVISDSNAAKLGKSRTAKQTAALGSFLTRFMKDKEEKEKEAQESEKARALSAKSLINSNEESTATLVDSASTSEKRGLFSSVGGFIGNIFGSIGNILNSPSAIAKLGIGALLFTGIGERIAPIAGKFLENVVAPAISGIGNFVIKRMPQMIESAANTITTVMPSLVKAAYKVTSSMFTTTYEMIRDSLGLGKSTEKIIDSTEVSDYTSQGYNVVDNGDGTYLLPGQNQYFNSDGELSNVSNTTIRDRLIRTGVNSVLDPSTAKRTAKTVANIATLPARLIPKVGSPIARTVSNGVGELVEDSVSKLPWNKAVSKTAKAATKKSTVGSVVKEANDVITKGLATNVAETTAKKGAKLATEEIAETATEKVAKSALKNTSKSSIGSIVKISNEKIATMALDDVTETATEKVVNSVSKKATKAAKKKATETATKTAVASADNVAAAVFKSQQKNVDGIISSFAKKFNQVVNSAPIKKVISDSKFIRKLSDLMSTVLTKFKNIPASKIGKISKKLTNVAGSSISGVAKFVPYIGAAFILYDAVSGALEAEYLFGVPSDSVDAPMRVISSVFKTILGLGIGPLFDIILEIATDLTGVDYKKDFATKLYAVLVGGSSAKVDKLKASQVAFELETQKYNAANKTNLSTNEYSDLKESETKWYKLWNKKNYSQYKVTQEEITAELNKRSLRTDSSVSTTSTYNDYDYTADSDYTTPSYSNWRATTGYGKGKSKSNTKKQGKFATLGFGSFTQNDPRWANVPIGKFNDGTISTMESGGCGPTALSNVLNSIGGKVNPVTVAKYASNNGYISDGGANEGLFTSGAKSLGLESKKLTKTSVQSALSKGEPVIIAGKSRRNDSLYSPAGHIVSATAVRGDNAIVTDPEVGTVSVPIKKLTSEMTHAWSYKKNVGYGKSTTTDTKKERKRIGGASSNSLDAMYQSMTADAGKNTNSKPVDVNQDINAMYQMMAQDPVKSNESTATLKTNSVTKKASTSTSNVNTNPLSGTKRALYEAGLQPSTVDPTNTRFHDSDFYVGLTPDDLIYLNALNPTLNSKAYPLFYSLYHQYVTKSGANKLNLTSKISKKSVEEASDLYDIILKLDENAAKADLTAKGLSYKNGLIHINQTNPLWANMPWGKGTMRNYGGDISSLAMILGGYTGRGVTPDYLMNNVLLSNWYDQNGLKDDTFTGTQNISNTKSAQIYDDSGNQTGSVRFRKAMNTSTIKSALTNHKLVYMQGYKHNLSPFGGYGEAADVDTSNPESTQSIVGVYAKGQTMAVNDPATTANGYSYFPVEILNTKVGKKNTAIIKKAYVAENSNGSAGLSGAVDIANVKWASTDYTSTDKDASFTEKTSATLGNFIKVITNLISSKINGEDYRSIFEKKYTDIGNESIGDFVTTDTEANYTDKSVEDTSTNTATLASPFTTINSSNTENKKSVDLEENGGVSNFNKLLTNKVFRSTGSTKAVKEVEAKNDENSKVSPVFNDLLTNGIYRTTGKLPPINTTGKLPSLGRGRKAVGYAYTNPFLAMFGIESNQNTTTEDDGNVPYNQSGVDTSSNGDYVGRYVKQFESGTSGPYTVSSGKGDNGGVSFGSYQLPSYGDYATNGSLKKFWDANYAKQYPEVTPGNNNAFIEAWKSAAKSNPVQFHNNEHKFIFDNYYKPQKNRLSDIIDPDTHSRSAQESVWSTAVQYGPNTNVLRKALNETNNQNTGSTKLVNKIQDYKTATIDNYFKSSRTSSAVRESLKTRHNVNERNTLLSISQLSPITAKGGGTKTLRALGYASNDLDDARTSVVEYVEKYTGKLGYSQAGSRNPETGYTDCSGLMYYAYLNTIGMNIGGYTGAQYKNENGIDVDVARTMGTYPSEFRLKPGDLLYFANPKNTNTEVYPDSVGHVEMYIGNGRIIGIGKTPGPTVKILSSYVTEANKLKQYYLKARRFIKDSSDVKVSASTSSTNVFANMLSEFVDIDGGDVTTSLGNVLGKVVDYQNTLVENYLGNDSSIGNGRKTKSTAKLSNSDKKTPTDTPIGRGKNTVERVKTATDYFTKTLGGVVTSKYGAGEGLDTQFHKGVDIGAVAGTPIRTPVGGKVVATGSDATGYGNYAVIKDESGNNHIFGHMKDKAALATGSVVTKDDIIGQVGSTGHSSGNHLHYEVRKGDSKNSAINPDLFRYGNQDTTIGRGGASKDIDTKKVNGTIIDKLNIAVKTDGVENKLDILIDVVKDITTVVSKDIKSRNIQQTSSTNKSIGKGNGKEKTNVVVANPQKASNSNTADIEGIELRNIHTSIAKPKYQF